MEKPSCATVSQLVGLLIHLSVDWQVAWFVCQFVHLLVCKSVGLSLCCSVGLLICLSGSHVTDIYLTYPRYILDISNYISYRCLQFFIWSFLSSFSVSSSIIETEFISIGKMDVDLIFQTIKCVAKQIQNNPNFLDIKHQYGLKDCL